MNQLMTLTAPIGIPSAVLRSSDRFPGFFSFSLVSNSLPYWSKQQSNILMHIH